MGSAGAALARRPRRHKPCYHRQRRVAALWQEHDLRAVMCQIPQGVSGNKKLLSTMLQQIFRKGQPPSHHRTCDFQRSLTLQWEGLSLFSVHLLETARDWKTAAKMWSSSSSSASRRAWASTFAFLSACVGWQSFAPPDQSTGKKIEWGTSAKRLNYQTGFSSVCVRRHIIWKCFSFSFWLLSHARRARALPCTDSSFTLPSGRVHAHGRQMVLFVRRQKDYLPEQFCGGKEREEEGASKAFCTNGQSRS